MQTRQERVNNLKEFIKENSNGEDYFDLLYGKLLEEIKIEKEFNNDRKSNSYLNNLMQTDEKQAEMYTTLKVKGKKTGSAFINFLSHFTQDLAESDR